MTALKPARVLRVPFATDRPQRTGPVTWSQQHMLALYEALTPDTASLNPRFGYLLRPGVSEVDVSEALRDAMVTFEALRTVYVPPPEGPAQRVLASGELVVGVVETGAPADGT